MKRWWSLKFLLILIVTLAIWIPAAGANVSAAETGSISGTVYEADGVTPLADIYVSGGSPGYSASACTNASGNFVLEDLPVDVAFQVQAAPPWATCVEWKNYVQEFWPESRDPNGAADVVLTDGNPDQTGIDFTLDAGGLISGIVYASDGTTPLQNIAVSIHDENRTYSQAFCSDANGQYAIHGTPLDLPVYVRTDAYLDNWCNAEADYVSEYWPESPVVGGATPIELTSGDSERTDIDFTVDAGGFVAGTVYAANGMTPLPNALVFVEGNSSTYDLGACTDQNGNYIIHNLPLNVEFRVKARSNYDPSWCNTGEDYLLEYWPESADPEGAGTITLTEGSPGQSDIDFTLADAGSINGTVFEADGVTPISNIFVVAEGSPNIYQGACTDASGHFTISGLPLDVPLHVQAFPSGVNCGEWKDYSREYWLEKTNPDLSDSVLLTTENPDRTGINFTLDPAATITGTVYAADGVTPLEGIFVTVYGDIYYGANGCTDENGHYTIAGLPFDTQLRVHASPFWTDCGPWKNYVEEYWPEAIDQNSASAIVMTAASPHKTDVNFTLEQGGVISGTTYAADGITRLPHILVTFEDDNSDYSQGICTNDNGDYEFHGAPFNVQLRVRTDSFRESWCDSGGDYIPEYWQEAPDSASATVITLSELSSPMSGINFTLAAAGSISGTVYAADETTPIPNLHVSVLGGDTLGPSACTDSAGNYTIHNVPFDLPVYVYAHGGLTWCGNPNTYSVEFYDEVPGLSGAVPLTVSEATPDLTDIDFTVDAIPTPSPDPFLRAWYVDDDIEVYDWPAGTTFTLEIEDPATPEFPDFSTQVQSSNLIDRFDLSGQFDIEPGMFVVLSGNSLTKILWVDDLKITNIDQAADTVTGTTGPNSWLWMFFPDSCCRSTVADADGLWTFDFSVPGDNGEPIADVRPGSSGSVHVPSGDGSTSMDWFLPAKTLHVVPKYPEVHGHDWPANTEVELIIDDDADPNDDTPLFTATKNTDEDPWCGSPCFDLSGIIDLDRDLYVTLRDGDNTKTVQISRLEVTSINLNANTISGRADPGSRVAVNIWSQNGIARYVTTKSDGTWVANFSVPGDEDFEQETADLQAGDHGRAIQLNPDGSDDGTLEYWTAELPVVDSVVRASTNPTNAASVNFTVTFSDTVKGVDLSDFSITKTGLSDTAVTKVVGSGDTYTVTVKTGLGNGTLRLNVVDNDSIRSEVNIPLGGPGTGNGNFNTGEEYTVARSAPGVPVLLSPAPEALLNTLQPTLDWKDSAPIADHYQVQVASNSNFSSLVWDETDITESTFPVPSALLPGSLYYWRVRAFNLFDVASGWSIVRAFKTPLVQPALTTPTEGAALLIDRPTFAWDAVPGATSYVLHISRFEDFSTLLLNVTVNGTQYTVTKDLPQNKTLYWRVRAKAPGVTGPWSAKGTFTTGNPPTAPILVAPANNALVKNYAPTFDWNNSKVPTGTTFKHYEIQWDEDPSFASPETHTTTPQDITDSDFTPSSDLASNMKYYWRVRAVNTIGVEDHTSGWSAVWSFRAAIPAPSGLTVIPDLVTPRQPTFEWDDASGVITSYTIQVSTVSNFSTLLVNSTTVNSFYDMLKNLPVGKTIYWRVRVNGPNGPSSWSKEDFLLPVP